MNSFIARLFKFIKNPYKLFVLLIDLGYGRFLCDKCYIKAQYLKQTGRMLNLRNPQTFNEKLQWLKLYDRNPEYVKWVDKYAVKEAVAEKIGEQYVIPTIGVWKSFEDIDFSLLPEQFVLKCTHDSGGLVICKDKSSFDYDNAKIKIEKSLNTNYYFAGREWPYKYIDPKIIAEQYMEDEKTRELRDYKFFAFNGEVKAMYIASERQDESVDTKFDFFDRGFNHLDLRAGHPNALVSPEKPENYEKMIELAQVLSSGIPQVRVDFYEVNGNIFFGEMTFFHDSGICPFEPKEWDGKFGAWIALPK